MLILSKNCAYHSFAVVNSTLNFRKIDFEIYNPSQDSSIGSISAWYRGGPGSNPGKGENFSVKISNWINPAVVAWW